MGFVLFCTYSSARFSDAARAEGFKLAWRDAFCLVETKTSFGKGHTLDDRKMKALPLIANGCCLHHFAWADTWQRARSQLGLNQDSILMPAYSETTGCFLERPMTASEGNWFFREALIMIGLGEDYAMFFSTHSMKRTILHWASVSRMFTLEERRRLGHHFDAGLRSPLTYSPEELVVLQGKLDRIYRAIRAGSFDPDLSGAQLLAAIS